jgi:Ubiquitin carboxyl-terminal hydrolase
VLRNDLTKLSAVFNVGNLADSNEALSIILNRLHEEHGHGHCTENNKCIAHKVFSGSVLRGINCKLCKTNHERVMEEDFIHLVYVSELIEFASSQSHNGSFAYLLSGGFNTILSEVKCPKASCNGSDITANTALIVNPPAVAISIIWPSFDAEYTVLSEFLSLMTIQLSTIDIFTTVNTPRDMYIFKGMICYYGRHYIGIFQDFSQKIPHFLLFDDARVRPIGTWTEVKDECLRSRYQPVLLLYEHDEWGVNVVPGTARA